MVVFLLLGVIWAAVLVPPWLQARREARPIASIMSFRSQLWSLQRATPTYGDTYDTYDAYDSYVDEGDAYAADGEVAAVGAVAAGAAVHPFPAAGRTAPVSPGVVGAVVRSPEDGVPRGLPGAATAAARRAHAFRRRRQILSLLVLAAAGSAVPAVLLGGPWIPAAAGAGTLLVIYLALLVRRGRHEVERAQKVRYLTPIRAPRPSVVVIGSGAAR